MWVLTHSYSFLQDTGRFWPGLGGSDTDYALALTFAPVFEFAAVPLALLMTHRSPFNVTFLIGLLFMAVGGTMYALAKNVETVWFGRGVIGAAGGLCIPALHTYIGEMGTLMDDIRRKQGKKPRKFTLYIAFSFILNGGFMVSFGKLIHITIHNACMYIKWMHASIYHCGYGTVHIHVRSNLL